VFRKKKNVIRVTLEKKEALQKHRVYSGVNLYKWVIFTEPCVGTVIL